MARSPPVEGRIREAARAKGDLLSQQRASGIASTADERQTMAPLAITNAREFERWARAALINGNCKVFMRKVSRTLIIYDKHRVDGVFVRQLGFDWTGELYPVNPPTPKDARRWWHELWDDEVLEIRTQESSTHTIACMSRTNAWRELDPFRLDLNKDSFEVIDEQALRILVGQEVARQMLVEVLEGIGISVRYIDRHRS